jgi:outer membrane lipoprotein-sorting protein
MEQLAFFINLPINLLTMKAFLVSILLFAVFQAKAQDPVVIIDQMRAKIKTIQKYSFELHTKERFGSDYVTKKLKFNMQESPKKVYMKDMVEGIELLYVKGWNSNKAYINPNGFPWVNVSLSIYDSRVIAENHHTINDLGLGFVPILLNGFESTVKKAGKSRSSLYTYLGEVTWNGKACHKIQMLPPSTFKYVPYTTDRDQKLMELSRRVVASDYLIKEKNGLTYTRTIKKGTKLMVPSAYAKKVIVYIEKSTKLPLVQILYDDKGLFEKFEYKNVNLYPKFSSTEWTTDCPSYGF